MRRLLIVLPALLLLTGCPPADRSRVPASKAQAVKGHAPLSVALPLTDLGLTDGQYVREAHAALLELELGGQVIYTPAGDPPAALNQEAAGSDVGMPVEDPVAGSPAQPGTMSLAQAEALLDALPPSDLLLLSSPRLVEPALRSIATGSLTTKALLVLDNVEFTPPVAPAVPVSAISYDTAAPAFLLGIAAATSSNTQLFAAIGSTLDPDMQRFYDGLYAGLRFHTNGADLIHAEITPAADGTVTLKDFQAANTSLSQQRGSARLPNHYIVVAGRATPSIMYSLSTGQGTNYALGAWGDFTPVRPARIVACAVKHPGVVLTRLLGSADALRAVTTNDTAALRGSFEEGATGVTDFSLYRQFNPDGDDIAAAVASVEEELLSGDLLAEDAIAQYKSEE